MGTSSINGPFSMAMLNNQRVNMGSPNNCHSPMEDSRVQDTTAAKEHMYCDILDL